MIKETMTREERIVAAINLEPVDRVPVAPLMDFFFSARQKGISGPDVVADPEKAFQAQLEVWEDVSYDSPGYGMFPFLMPYNRLFAGFVENVSKYPGQDDPAAVNQDQQTWAEKEVIAVEDYDDIINLGWFGYIKKLSRRVGGSTLADGRFGWAWGEAKAQNERYMRLQKEWDKRGIPIISGADLMDPQMALSLGRTLTQFTLDLYRRPDKVKAALDAMVDDFAQHPLESLRATGQRPSPSRIPGIIIACERCSGQYYNLDIFERFFWPYLKKLVLTWHDAGYVTTLHFDTDWIRNIPYLLELPPRSCICELDSITDIFKTKEILKDHMCIMGDVPAALLSTGTPEEVEAYCKKLIDIVGKDGGFILSTGCTIPPDTRWENFKAMVDTAKNYYPHG